jgi:hypothetical protein
MRCSDEVLQVGSDNNEWVSVRSRVYQVFQVNSILNLQERAVLQVNCKEMSHLIYANLLKGKSGVNLTSVGHLNQHVSSIKLVTVTMH